MGLFSDIAASSSNFTLVDHLHDFGPTGSIPYLPTPITVDLTYLDASYYQLLFIPDLHGNQIKVPSTIADYPALQYIVGPATLNGSYALITPTMIPGSVASSTTNIDPYFGWAVIAYTGHASDQVVNLHCYGSNFATCNVNLTANIPYGNLQGPYQFYYNAPGTFLPSLVLFYHPNQSSGSWTTFAIDYHPRLRFFNTFNLFQQAVPVTISSQGNNLGTGGAGVFGTPIQQGFTGSFDKTGNRGDAVTSLFAIEKWNGSAYVTAVVGVDITLSGPLTDDNLIVTYVLPGFYKVINNVAGTTSGSAGTNSDFNAIIISVTAAVPDIETDLVNLPLLQQQQHLLSHLETLL